MKKFSLAYVKSNPVLFGVIFVVFGLLVYMMLNKSAASEDAGGGSTQVIQQGPSEGLQIAGMQANVALQTAQLQAASANQAQQIELAALKEQTAAALAIAGLDAQYRTLELNSTERVASRTIDAQLLGLDMQLDHAYASKVADNQFMVDYARVAADSATTQLQIGANLQRDLSAQQLEAFKIGAFSNTVSTLKTKDRDRLLRIGLETGVYA